MLCLLFPLLFPGLLQALRESHGLLWCSLGPQLSAGFPMALQELVLSSIQYMMYICLKMAQGRRVLYLCSLYKGDMSENAYVQNCIQCHTI